MPAARTARTARPARPATIRDVARLANVSVATVSRVFNDSGPVSAAARGRIERAAAKLRYVPNVAARSLIMRRTGTIGVVLPDLHGEFFSEVIRGIDGEARRQGYHLLVSGSHSELSDVTAALSAMSGRVDGLIAMWPDADAPTLRASFPPALPMMLLNSAAAGSGVDALNVDNVAGARAMTEHLLSHGYRRLAFIRGPERNADAAERLRGFRAALGAAGVARRPGWEPAGDFTEAGGHEATRRLLRGRTRPRAIFAANDAMAVGALGALRDAGVAVPDEMAVAGFDDIPIARYTTPPLTTVQVPICRMGVRAAERLVHAIANDGRHRRTKELVPTALVVRQSCGTHAGGGS